MTPGELARRHIRALNERDLDADQELLPDGFTVHHVHYQVESGRAGYPAVIEVLLAAIPDLSLALHDVVRGNRAVSRYTERGTNTRPLPGLGDGQPTGHSYEKHGIALYRAEHGRLAECWMQEDDLGSLQQLALLPSPETSATCAASAAGLRRHSGH